MLFSHGYSDSLILLLILAAAV